MSIGSLAGQARVARVPTIWHSIRPPTNIPSMLPKDLPLPSSVTAAELDRVTRIEQRLALVCALLLSASVFLILGRGPAVVAAGAGLLLFPLVGLIAWLLVPAARQHFNEQGRSWRGSSGSRLNIWLWIGLPLLAYFLTALAGLLVHHEPLAALDKPVRMLLLSVGLFVWLHLRMNVVVFRHVVILTSISAGFLAFGNAMYERFVMGIDRVGVSIFPIQFADLSMSVALICAVWVVGLPRSPLRKLAGVSGALAIVACALTSSRGAFAALLVLPWLIAYASGTALTLRRVLVVLGVVSVTVALALGISARLRDRVHDVSTDLDAYAHGNANTSLGMRLQMWDNSLRVFAGSPLLGAGSAGYMKSQQRGVAEGRLDPAILEYNGAHNQYIDALAKGGLLHGVSTLALFLAPWLWFLRRCRQAEGVPLHAVAGFAVASAFPLFALTQHVLNHGSGAMFYAGSIVLFALAAGSRYGTIPAIPSAVIQKASP
jgi:O-antigen ligase